MSDTPHLKMGDQGEWVGHAQTLLAEKGFPGTKAPDNVFDQSTHDQVVAFQEAHHIHPVNGEVGDHTWAALGMTVITEHEHHEVHSRRTAEDMQ